LERIEKAVKHREKAVIHGDYDADGITSAAILSFAFNRIGLAHEVFLPSRFESGYGIKADWVEQKKAEGVDLIVTTDCGSSAVEACHRASEIGMDLLITDHHTPNPDMTGFVAHINPHLPDCGYPFKDLSGAGVAFKLAQALVALVPPSFQAQYREDLPVDLAMVGTIADVMPLAGENRRIVVDGLDRVRIHPSPGLRALLESARCAPEAISVEAIGFKVAPRLNAAGRLGSPRLAFDLLTTTDPQAIAQLVKDLEKANDTRKKLAAKATEQALERIRHESTEGAVILADPEWGRGILGILAARVMEATGCPVFVASLEGDLAHGSARVPPGFNAAALLDQVKGLTEAGGGHAGAAGFTVQASRWGEFEQALREVVLGQGAEAAAPELLLDGFLEPGDGLGQLLQDLSVLEPFGEGFQAPVFSICRFEARGRYTLFGENHLKINLGAPLAPLEAVGFGMAEWAKDLDRGPVDIAIEHGEDHWNGRSRLRPKIVALRPSLKEQTETARREEVTRLPALSASPRGVVWDARGGGPLREEACLRIGYGPDWTGWWFEVVPGKVEAWKSRAWSRFGALPADSWPGICSTGYGGEIPAEWNGEILEILWPPLRKADRAWLRSILASVGGDPLVRLQYDPGAIEDWLKVSYAEPTRENLAVLYRALKEENQLRDFNDLPLKPATLGLCLEILLDLGLAVAERGMIRKTPSPPKRDLSESSLVQAWEKYQRSLEAWADQALNKPAADLVSRWLAPD
jgi:single-stranded-DNA-specific exonuclease